jgi:leader peptidase (prepilin peptidase)/N-methyltransferase
MSDAWIRAIVAFPVGLAIGSFMTVVAARVPAGESLIHPRSHCPVCGAQIRNRDNVPVIGWLLLRGRCRDCGARISIGYPLLELATGLLVAGAFFVFDDALVALPQAVLLAMLPAISAIDIERHIIPNKLVYPALIGLPVLLVLTRLLGAPVDLRGMAIGFAADGGVLFLVALVSGGMGMGDVKLAALIGVVLGALGLRYVAVAAGAAIVLGGVGGIVALIAGKGRKGAIPFGPYLAAGAVVAAVAGEPIARWYLRTLLG